MRDLAVDSTQFTAPSGEVVTIKEMREYETMTARMKYQPRVGQLLDEIAAEVYGEDSEFMAYKLFDHNVTKIVESGFTLDNVKEIEVPN